MVVRSPKGNIIHGTEVKFLGDDEASYPQLTRLCLDFDFRITAVSGVDNKKLKTKRFVVSFKSEGASDATTVTPLFNSLAELENHTNDHIIEILHTTVFDTIEED